MPRDGSNVYHRPPGTDAVSNTTIASAPYNVWIADVEQDLNLPRPIVAGGTGATSGGAALAAMGGEQAKQNVDNYDSFPFVSGSFSSAATATNPPVAGHVFSGIAYVNATDATSMFIEARDQTDGRKWVRQKNAGVWGAWGADGSDKVPLAGGTMTGELIAPSLKVSGAAPILEINKSASGAPNLIRGYTNAAIRWDVILGDATAEGGSNAGSDFTIQRWSDASAFIDVPFKISRSSGVVTVGGALYANNDGNFGFVVETGAQTNYEVKMAANNYVFAQRTTGVYGWQSPAGTAMLFDTAMNVTFGASVTAVSGYKTRAGAGGALGGNVFNINWVSPNLPMWIDGTNIGTINITTSDYRIKKDIADAPSALEDLLQWRVITYTGKKWGIFEENDNVRHSFVAHELQEISPDCVVGEKDGEQPQSLDLVPLVARMAKAIQELAAQVAELKAKSA